MLRFSDATPTTDRAKSANRLQRAGVAAAIGTLGLMVVLAWSLTERLPVTVIVSPDSVTGRVGPASVQAPRLARGPVTFGFFLQGSDPSAPILWGPTTSEEGGSARIAQLIYRIGAESAWSNPRVQSLATGIPAETSASVLSPRFGDWFVHPFGGHSVARPGLAISSATPSDTFQVDADLLRPRTAAGVYVGDPSGGNGLLFYFRPENRDVMWYEIRNGQWYGPVATAPFRAFAKDPASSVQDVVRLALGGLPVSVMIVGAIAGLGAIERRRRRHVGFPVKIEAENGREVPESPVFVHRSSPYERLPGILAATVAVAGLAATMYVANALLDRIPHVQDSVAYVFQAKTFAMGRLWVPTPPHPQFFTHEFIVMDGAGRWFSKYPPGWPMILALGELVQAPWIVDPICGALSLVLLYRLGTEIYRPRVGLLAAVLGLSAPFFLFLSGSLMSHASGLLFTLLMTWCFLRTTRSNRPVIPATLMGVALGILFLIRPFSALPLTLPFAAYAAVQIARQPGDGIRRFVPTVIAAIPFIAAFLAYNRVFTGSWFYPTQQLWWGFDQIGFGPGHGPWGFTPVDALNNTSRNLTELLTHGFGWPAFITLAILPIPFLVGRARTWDWLFLAGFVGLIVGYACWWADGIMFGPRFFYEGFGFMILLTARGFDVLLGLGDMRTAAAGASPSTATIAKSSIYVLAAALVAFNGAYYLPGQLKLYHGYNYVSRYKIDALQASGIHQAVVFTNTGQQYEWWEYGEVFSANDPLLQGDVVFARDLGDVENQKLLADFPGRTFYRLNGTLLTPIRN